MAVDVVNLSLLHVSCHRTALTEED